jgi:hypothetical protein
MPLHSNLTLSFLHPAIWREYADAAARTGDATLVAADDYKLAIQLDDDTVWILLDYSGPTWKQVTPDGAIGTAAFIDFPARKGTAGTITKGQAVYATGYDVPNDCVLVELAKADAAGTMPCWGIASSTFTEASSGSVRMQGEMEGLDTSTFAVGDFLHVSPTTAGALQSSHVSGPNLHQVVAKVARVDATTGVIVVATESAYDHLSNSTPEPTGTAASGTSAFSSRRDHVHALGSTVPTSIPAIMSTGLTAAKGEAVYVVGWDTINNCVVVDLAVATSGFSDGAIGIAAEALTDAAVGKVLVSGVLAGVDTSAFNAGDPLFVDGTTPGAFTSTYAVGTDQNQPLGWVLYQHATNGVILVNLENKDRAYASNPAAVGTAGPGVQAAYSRGDHVHAHGNQASDGNMHAAATASVAGFATAAQITKLDGIATGAEVSKLRQSAEANLSASFSTSSLTFVDVLTINITTQASGILNIWGVLGGTLSGNGAAFLRLTVDGTQVGDASTNHGHGGANGAMAMTCVARITGLSAASHAVVLQARVGANTLTADPTTADQGAGLLVQEVTA